MNAFPVQDIDTCDAREARWHAFRCNSFSSYLRYFFVRHVLLNDNTITIAWNVSTKCTS